MRKRWPKILKLGNVYVGALKLIDLVSKPVEYIVHRIGDITLVIIRGRYMYKIRESQSASDKISRVTFDRVISQVQHALQETVSVVTRLRGVLSLGESQNLQDGITTDTKPRQTVELEDSQTAQDGSSYTTADRSIGTFDEIQQVQDGISTPTATPTTSSLDEILVEDVDFSTAPRVLRSLGESVPPYDSMTTDIKQAVLSQFSEVTSPFDYMQVLTPVRVILRFAEGQWSDDIPQAYVPTDEETLIIRAFPESTYAYDRVLVTTAPAATPFDMSVWYAEYQVTMAVNIGEQQSTSDELVCDVIPVQAVTLLDSQNTYDELTLNVISVQTVTPQETQDSSDALGYSLHNLVTTHPDTFEISEWYAEYSVT